MPIFIAEDTTGFNIVIYLFTVLFYRYEVIIRACTDASCSESKPVFFVTKEAPPSGMQVPTVTPVSDSDLLIEWQSPLHPNGNSKHFFC